MLEAMRLLMCLSPLHSAQRISILDSNMSKRISWIELLLVLLWSAWGSMAESSTSLAGGEIDWKERINVKTK